MMPIGAYAPRWMHWGTFVLSQEPVAEPARLAREAWRAAGRAPEGLWDLAIGESRIL